METAQKILDFLMGGGALAAFVLLAIAVHLGFLRLGREYTKLETDLDAERVLRRELERKDEDRVQELKRKDDQYHDLIRRIMDRRPQVERVEP